MIRALWVGFLTLLMICLILVGIEFACFYAILQMPEEEVPADLIAVFMGAPDRVRKGYDIANRCKAPYLTLSPASRRQIDAYNQKYGKAPCYRFLIEDQADTTFQNALLVGRLAQERQCRSVILVTHAVHMPRSYLLLRIQLLGSGVSLFPAPVARDAFSRWPWQWSRRQKKMVYNEMIEFWGSLFEKVNYHWHGGLPQKSLKQNPAVSVLREWLLFEI